MSEKSKTKQVEQESNPEEEEYKLVYKLWIENLTINMAEGCTVNMSTGKPKDEPRP